MPILYALYITILLSFIPSVLYADSSEQFARDKDVALKQQNGQLSRTCLADFKQRVHSEVKLEPAGSIEFSDLLSQVSYKTLYWKNSDRGVAFVMPVRVRDPKQGMISADVACFYSLTDNGLEFQLSQQILRRL